MREEEQKFLVSSAAASVFVVDFLLFSFFVWRSSTLSLLRGGHETSSFLSRFFSLSLLFFLRVVPYFLFLRLVDHHGFGVVARTAILVRRLWLVVVERFHGFGGEVGVTLGYHSIDDLLDGSLWWRFGDLLIVGVRLGWGPRDFLLSLVLRNSHSAGLDSRWMSAFQ